MASFRRAFFINFMSSSGSTVVQFVVSMLMARLLTPAEIGVYSITVVFVNIAHVFRDFGVASYLQREPDLSPEKIRSAIGVLYSSTWLIAALLFVASWPISDYFGYVEVRPVMQVLALGFVFIPFSSVMLSLLLREFAAGKLAWVNLAGTAAYTVTCLGLAWAGFGTMSLAWANVANIAACGLAYLPLRPKGVPWLPSFKQWGRVIRFGLGTILTNTLSAINNALPDLLLGKLGSPHQVGLVSRANSTVNIFSYIAGAAVNFGALPYLSQAHHRQEGLGPILNRSSALLTGIGWPALALTALLGREIVLTLYGSNWLECVPAIPALAMAAGLGMLFNYSGSALTAIGRPYLAAFPVAATALSRIALVAFLFAGGIAAFSWIILAATALALPVQLYLHARYLQHSPLSLLKAVSGSVIVTGACAAVCVGLSALLPAPWPPQLRLLVIAPLVLLVWYAALRLTRHALLTEVHLMLNKLAGPLKR